MHKASSKNKKESLSNRAPLSVRPIKALGQNFLRYEKTVWQVIQAADLKPDDIVIEIGPGRGALTLALAQKAKQVIAIEKDSKMVEVLAKILTSQNVKNVEVINGDALNFQFPISNFQSISNFQFSNYKVVANLPYNIATAVIMKFLESENPPKLMVVMAQKEVGQRICAKPPHTNKLAVFTQFYSQPKVISYVSRKCFYPQPKVDSAILKIIPNNENKKRTSALLFSKIVNAAFTQPRKQIINNLSNGLKLNRQTTMLWLRKNNIQPTQRPETLFVDEWLKLTATFPQVIMYK